MKKKPSYEELHSRVKELEREAVLRQRAKEAIRKYDLIVSAVQDPMSFIDTSYLYQAVNDVYLKIFDRSREDIVGHPVEELVGKEVFETQIRKHLDRCLSGEEVYFEDWFEYPNWGRRYLIMNFYPFFAQDGTVSGIAQIVRDITKRKKAEEALKRTTQALMIRNQIDQIFLSAPDQDMYPELLNMVLEGTQSTVGIFEDIGSEGENAHTSMSKGPTGECRISHAIKEFSPEQWNDIRKKATLLKKIFFMNRPAGNHAPDLRILVAPVMYHQDMIATIVVGNVQRDYTDEDSSFLEPIVNHIAPILHARLQRNREENERKLAQEELRKAHSELEKIVENRTSELLKTNVKLTREIEERSRVEAALRQSEEMLRAQYRGIPVPTFTWKRSGDDFVLVDYNKATEDFTRGLIPNFVGRTISELYHDRPDIISDVNTCLKQNKFIRREISYRMFTTDEEKFIALSCAFVPPDMVLVHMEDITESKLAQEKLKRSEMNLRILSSQLMNAKEEERKRISQELHDSVGQYLTSIKFNTENIISQMERRSRELSIQALKDSIPVIQATIDEVRRISMDLRPSTLDDLGILATISWFCREFQTVYSDITVTQKIGLDEEDVPHHLKIIIFRIIQEALNNVAKHSRADTIDITLMKRDGCIELSISDNGQGFDVQEKLMSEDYNKGLGLASMEERAELSNGCFSIDSVKGLGTLIMTTWRLE